MLNITIAGEAGQGLVTVGSVLTKCLVRSGYFVLVTQSYQSRIRGGHNTFSVRVGDRQVLGPTDEIDILVALNEESIQLHRDALSAKGFVIVDEKVSDDTAHIRVPFKELAGKRQLNVAAFGVLGSFLGLDKEAMAQMIQDFFGKKHADAMEQNLDALNKAFAWGEEQSSVDVRLPKVEASEKRITVNGNEAIALGAIAAGLKCYFFYPMTPATSIALTVIKHADAMGITVEQAEDEIAAVNMAIGASFAGQPAMAGTSGGGFALMTEGVSLAGITETPVVIAIAQRPGPATGLPTRTEQGDLEFVLHGGHGDFPRAIFAPGSVEECFDVTCKAFHVAEKYQTPVFILTDQYLADSSRAVKPFPADVEPVTCGGEDPSGNPENYKRYKVTESGISPRCIPGKGKALVVADSDEHTEDGHLTEDLTVHTAMVEKRFNKFNALCGDVMQPEFTGDDAPDLLFVCWGSSRGAVLEAAEMVRSQGRKAAVLHFPQVWPLVADQFIDTLKEAKKVVCVEGNATGQFAKLIRRETGFFIEKKVLRCDGLPFTASYILDHLNE